MNVFAGLDIGSRNIKCVIIDKDSHIIHTSLAATGVTPRSTARDMLHDALSSLSISPDSLQSLYATGYGRNLVDADKTLSEVTCHARGVRYFLPQAATIIDIGGQDAKAISLHADGSVHDFVMNDKCAAGTGRFLEMVAIRLGIEPDHLSSLAETATKNVPLTSTCVVFADTEIVSHVANGFAPADIARAVHLSIASRIAAQVNQLNWQPPLAFTGGVAYNHDLTDMLSQQLHTPLSIPKLPVFTGALGAALSAYKANA